MLPNPYTLTSDEYKEYKIITGMIKEAQKSKQDVRVSDTVSEDKMKEAYAYLDRFYSKIIEKSHNSFPENSKVGGLYVHNRTKKVIFIDKNECVLRNINNIPPEQIEMIKLYADTLEKDMYNEEMITLLLEDIFLNKNVCIK